MEGQYAFRLPFILQIIPALLVGTTIHAFPYSPRWLAMRGRDTESLAALAKLRRRPDTDETVQLEFKGICAEVQFEQALRQRKYPGASVAKIELQEWLELFTPRYFRRTAIAVAIPFFQQVRNNTICSLTMEMDRC